MVRGGDTGGYGELVQKVVASKPRVILARSRSVAAPLAAATGGIPIVMVGTISKDLSASLARPSRNVTGLSTSADDQLIYGKPMEFLGELTKPGARIAWLGTKLIWDAPARMTARRGATLSKLLLEPIFVSNPINGNSITEAFAVVRTGRFDGLLVSPATELSPHRAMIARLALAARLPAMANLAAYVDAGLLASYGAAFDEIYARAAHYLDKILKGAKPGDLPIEQPDKMQLVINRKTATEIRIAIPQSLLLRAERVIE